MFPIFFKKENNLELQNTGFKIFATISVLWLTFPCGTPVPISIHKGDSIVKAGNNNSIVGDFEFTSTSDPGCRYKAQSYLTREEVPTDEPCLRCQCKKRAVVCKLRICTEPVPNAPPPGCVIVKKAKSCCPKLVCPESKKITREQRLSTGNNKNESIPAGSPSSPGQGFCIHDGSVYAEGSAMKSNFPCDYCFCIRGDMKCSRPQCVIPLNGCKPRYRSFACCPTNYDCNESNTTAIIQTVKIPSSTPIPQFLKGCQVMGHFIYEGEPVLPIHLEPDKEHVNLCQTCFCLGGIVRCRPLECNRPIENCLAITEDGHCCPSRYECENKTTLTMIMGGGRPTQRVLEKVRGEDLLSLNREKTDERGKSSGETQPHHLHSNIVLTLKSPQNPLHSSKSPSQMSSLTNANYVEENRTLSTPIPVSDRTEIKLKSDLGSREERRNKGKDDFSYKTSYEDDERDYLFGVPSLESIDHELISKMTFDGTTTEAKEDELKVVTLKYTPSEEKKMTTDLSFVEGPSESGDRNEIIESTTMPESIDSEASLEMSHGLEDGETFSKTQNENINLDQIQNLTFPRVNESKEIQALEKIASEFNMSSSSSSVGDVALTSSSSSLPVTPGAPVSNLHFIPFGVEDAVVLPPISNINQTKAENESSPLNYETVAQLPIKITYDRETIKSSLIPPTPPKGYSFIPILQSSLPELEEAPGDLPNDPIRIVSSPQELKDTLRNVIMDVPVSTSLYNNGYYQNGIITNSNTNSSTTFPGQIFDDSGEHSIFLKESTTEEHILQSTTTEESQNIVPSDDMTSSIDKIQNPSRTYSKFGIQDSPSYRRHETQTDRMNSQYQNSPTNKNDSIIHRRNEDLEQGTGVSKMKKLPMRRDDGDLDPIYKEDDRILESFEKDLIEGHELHNEFSKSISSGRKYNETLNPISITSNSTLVNASYENRSTFGVKSPPPTVSSRKSGTSGFRPVVAFPFAIPQKPKDSFLGLGLKLSGCNIYGKMYQLENVIPELSGPCVQCQCTEMGVQCSQLPC